MDVSIIIVNYNTVSFVCDAIDSVLQKTKGVKYEIIVVDNASGDNSKSVIEDRYKETVNYILLPENIGFGRANNEGAKVAIGRNLFLLNPDTILLNNAVKILCDYIDNNPNVGVCGGNMYSLEMELIPSFEPHLPSISTLFQTLFNISSFSKKTLFNYTDKPITVGYVYGADMMISKSIFDNVGGFDSDFFMYAEEAELSYRIEKLGYNSIVTPEAKIIHLEGQSFENISLKRIKMSLAGKKLYYAKRYGRKGEILFVFVNILLSISRIIIFFIFCKRKRMQYWQQYFTGIISTIK